MLLGNRDAEYLAFWQQLVLPVLYEYDPEVVLVSAGYDPAVGKRLYSKFWMLTFSCRII